MSRVFEEDLHKGVVNEKTAVLAHECLIHRMLSLMNRSDEKVWVLHTVRRSPVRKLKWAENYC